MVFLVRGGQDGAVKALALLQDHAGHPGCSELGGCRVLAGPDGLAVGQFLAEPAEKTGCGPTGLPLLGMPPKEV